jgi:pentatricopeptide repeat domain (PPR motif)
MQRQNVISNVIGYNAVISALEKGKLPDQALRVFEEMQWQVVVPDIITFSALISAIEKGNEPE